MWQMVFAIEWQMPPSHKLDRIPQHTTFHMDSQVLFNFKKISNLIVENVNILPRGPNESAK
jgi:hypothetical protein